MKKKHFIFLFILVIVILFLTVSFAHGGKTDSRGGHNDRNSGEYHYHHGYPAHDHYDIDGDGTIDCPYDFDDKTDHDSVIEKETETNKEYSDNEKEPSKKLTFKSVVKIIFDIILLFLVFVTSLVLPLSVIVYYIIDRVLVKVFHMKESAGDRIWLMSGIVGAVVAAVFAILSVLKDNDIL